MGRGDDLIYRRDKYSDNADSEQLVELEALGYLLGQQRHRRVP